MRDISAKYATLRTATAQTAVRVAPATLRLLRQGQLPKGDPLPVARVAAIQAAKNTGGKSDFPNVFPTPPRAAVLVMSDSIAAGRKKDLSGRLIVDRLKQEGLRVTDYRIIPDELELIERWLVRYADQARLDLVITSGGTGLSARDQTPEAMKQVITREVAGIAEAARAYSQDRLPYAMLSRGLAGTRGQTLIVSLPGSRQSTADYLSALFPAVLHAIKMIRNEGHAPATATATGPR